MEAITTDLVTDLYREHRADLARVRHEQLRLRRDDPAMKAQLDDIEAEITYLLLRHARPETVVEIGTFHGWSTTWILRALRDKRPRAAALVRFPRRGAQARAGGARRGTVEVHPG